MPHPRPPRRFAAALAALLAGAALAQTPLLPGPPPPASAKTWADALFKTVARGERLPLAAKSAALRDALGRVTPLRAEATAEGIVVTVPRTIAGGRYTLETTGPTTSTPVTVIGDARPNRVLFLIPLNGRDVTPEQLQAATDAYARAGVGLVRAVPLGGPRGTACDALLAELDINDRPLSLMLAGAQLLDGVLTADAQTLWHVDQELLWDKEPPALTLASVVEPGFPYAAAGEGVTIAVLDTRVGPSAELAGRLLPALSFLEPGRSALGASAEHGRLVAQRAAGSGEGVARAARVLPVEVCDGDGTCPASSIVQGVCAVLNRVEPRRLVLNLSVGGDTPNAVVNAVLEDAVTRGATVVASNRGQYADHFPAADAVPGVVSVGAARRTPSGWARVGAEATLPALVAPGATSVANVGGSSFAGALVSGALAHLRAACPNAAPAALERLLRGAARPEALFVADRRESGAGLLFVPARPVCP